MKEVQFDEKGIETITNGIAKPVNNARNFFDILGTMIDSDTQITFRLLGARAGHDKWVGYNLGRGHVLGGSTRMNSGTWRIRYGTDIKPRGKSFIGKYWESVRRYDESSRMLQAGGQFRQSFRIQEVDNKHLKYGTRMNPKIMSHGRDVLFVTGQDLTRYQREFTNFVRAGISF